MDDAEEKAAVAVGEAYISGALTALEDAPRTKLFYELLAEIAEAAGLRAYLPHRVTDPVAAAHLDPRSVYEIDRAHVTNAAVLIAYAGIPSFGVGIEVELAREHSVPVIVVAERERPISRLLLGNPAVVEVVKFADLDGLRRALGSALAAAASATRGGSRPMVSDDVVVRRFIASLEEARPFRSPRSPLCSGSARSMARRRAPSGMRSREAASSVRASGILSAATRYEGRTSAPSCCATCWNDRSPRRRLRSGSTRGPCAVTWRPPELVSVFPKTPRRIRSHNGS